MNFKKYFQEKEIIDIIGLFFVSRLLVWILGYLSKLIIINGPWLEKYYAFPTNLTSDIFFKWDAVFYLGIANGGYSSNSLSVVFFPLYPMMIRSLSFVFGHSALMGYLISNVSLLFAAIYFYKLLKIDFSSSIALWAVIFLLISPVSFFFSIIYTEGLFLFLVISGFYYARKKNWILTSIFIGLASITRGFVGIFILIPLIIEYLDIDFKSMGFDLKKIKPNIFYLFLVPIIFSIYPIYLYFKFGNGFLFLQKQRFWYKEYSSILTTLSDIGNYSIFYKIIFLTSIFIAVFLILYLIYRKVRLSYCLFSVIILFIYLSSSKLTSIPRYIGVIFPLYLGLSLLAKKYKVLEYLFLIASIMFLTLFIILFVNRYEFY